MSDYENNRRSTGRIAAKGLSAKLQVGEEKNTTECVVIVRDFSKGGASIFISFKASPLMLVRLTFEGVNLQPVEGVVAWCAPINNESAAPVGATHRVGLDFRPKDKVAEANLATTFDYVSQLASEIDEDEDENEF